MDLKLIFITFVVNFLGVIAEATLTITATPHKVQLGKSVVIRCDGSTSYYAYRIEIRRASFGAYSGSLLAEIDVGSGSVPVAKDTHLLRRGYTVQGQLDVQNAKETFLQLNIPETACMDNSQYICNVIGSMNGNGELPRPLETAQVMLSVTTLPDGLMMKVSPALNTKLGDTVLFWCRGHIGKPARDIVWERQRLDDETPERLSDGIQTADYVLDYGICHFSGESVLNYGVTREDQGALFTCRTDPDNDEVHYTYRLHISDLPLADTSSGNRKSYLTDSHIIHLTVFAYILFAHVLQLS